MRCRADVAADGEDGAPRRCPTDLASVTEAHLMRCAPVPGPRPVGLGAVGTRQGSTTSPRANRAKRSGHTGGPRWGDSGGHQRAKPRGGGAGAPRSTRRERCTHSVGRTTDKQTRPGATPQAFRSNRRPKRAAFAHRGSDSKAGDLHQSNPTPTDCPPQRPKCGHIDQMHQAVTRKLCAKDSEEFCNTIRPGSDDSVPPVPGDGAPSGRPALCSGPSRTPPGARAASRLRTGPSAHRREGTSA